MFSKPFQTRDSIHREDPTGSHYKNAKKLTCTNMHSKFTYLLFFGYFDEMVLIILGCYKTK